MATLGTIDKVTCYLVSQIIGLLQGPDLHVPGVTRGMGNVFVIALLRVTLLNARELRK